MSNFVLKRKYMCLNVIRKGILLTKNIMTGIKSGAQQKIFLLVWPHVSAAAFFFEKPSTLGVFYLYFACNMSFCVFY